jgi:hypothetical protein
MRLISSPTELTTAVTDAVIALLCIGVVVNVWRLRDHDRWKVSVWCWVFGLLALASTLGAVAHGLALTDSARSALWHPLYLTLGLTVALFFVGAVYDMLGKTVSRKLIPWCLGIGAGAYALTQILGGAFGIFLAYEAVVMVSVLVIYVLIAVSGRLPGATIMAGAIGLNLLAAAVQASDVSIRVIVPFDHNGVFHLVQIIAIAVLAYGLRIGLTRKMRNRQSSS